jgi:uncharacterized cupredoxin-like copper-binding protein
MAALAATYRGRLSMMDGGRMNVPARAFVALCVLAILLAACGSAPETLPADVQVTVELKDYSITDTPATIKAGTIKFGIRNSGAMLHEFDLIKTDLAPDKLEIDTAAAKAKTDGLVKQVQNIGVGKVATLSADLAPGHYVIICNVAGHYQLGMRAELTVSQ